jgi:hypothetical protein
MLLATKIIDGIEWQLWKTANPYDRILGPRYLVKKYPDGQDKAERVGHRVGSVRTATNTTRAEMLEQRITRLERQMSDLQRLFKTAIGFDENLAEHSELLRGLIAECPGLSQRGLCFTARQQHELSKGRVIELLRLGVGKFWRVEAGMYNALLYYPLVSLTQPEHEESGASMLECEEHQV